ncbi:stage III sporulation protein AG [Haloimpatiens lingqiaonensis]|uniref:stage III sporulation protein AG n=1 Tax=Haloimpatiens lingqiaonensis TaxID=1380675 RepID=UPI0010FF37FB|nr:stage III sporulation protein AG [Haloimpatiens lingqiaonensis]
MNFKDKLLKFKNELNKDKDGNKKIFNLIVIILIGCILMIAGSSFKGKKSINTVAANNQNTKENIEYTGNNDKEYEIFLQNQLKDKLEKIQGVGRVEVMIYFESGEEKVPAVNISNSDNVTNEEDTAGGKRKISQNNNDKNVVITNEDGSNKPLIVKKNKPRITGVLVVAQGAESKVTELRISKAVCALFDIPNIKVNVYPMKK